MNVTSVRVMIRGLLYMVVVAALFGLWQRSILAGAFMMSLLLFIDKVARFLWVGIARLGESAEG